MAETISYVDVANVKSGFDSDDVIIVQDKTESGATEEEKFAAMKRTTLGVLKVFMQAGLLLDVSTSGDTVTLTMKDAAGTVLSTKTISLADYVKYTDIVDNLTSSDASKVLSAKQGRALQVAKIDNAANDDNEIVLYANGAEIVRVSAGKVTDVKVEGTSVLSGGVANITGLAKQTDLTTHISNSDIHVTTAKKTEWDNKQAALVSGTNIKTINGQSVIGSGDIVISGGGAVQLKGEKTGAELNSMVASDVENGWAYLCTLTSAPFLQDYIYAAVVDGTSLSWVKLPGGVDLSNYVQKTRKINNYTLDNDITLNLTDLSDYEALTQAEALAILNA